MNGQFLPRKNPAKTVKGRGFLDRGLMKTVKERVDGLTKRSPFLCYNGSMSVQQNLRTNGDLS